MEEMIEQTITGQLLPLSLSGIAAGFMVGTVLYLLSHGIFKAFSLVNIK